jgi:Predicted hydrolases or acyltransferases (alpha/beta hydrolase superfamily)
MTIIAIHGNGGGGFRFSRLAEFMPKGVKLVAPTLPGFSNRPSDPFLTDLKSYAASIIETVSNEAAPRILLGHGIGGTILLEFAQKHAELAGGFIFHAPVGSSLKSRFFPNLMKIPMAPQLGRYLFSEPLLRPIFRSLVFSKKVPGDFCNQFFDEYRACSVFDQMFDIITPEWFASLKPISTPAALLWGARDRAIRITELKYFQPLLINSLTKVVDSWAHFPMIEEPEEYAQQIIKIAEDLIAAKSLH